MVNKIVFGDLVFPYQPRQKCGTGALLFMSGVSALTGLGASMYSATEAKEQNADMMNTSLNYNEHVRNDEHRIENENYWNRLNDMRTWYADRFNTEQKAAFDLWLKQNDPSSLLPAYANAGYNMSALSGASNMAMSPSSTPVVSQPSSPMQSPASIPSAMTPMSNQAQMLSSIGGLIKDLAGASKDSGEVYELLELLGPKVKNMLLQNDAITLSNDWIKARNLYKDKWWDQEFKNKVEEGNQLYWDAYFKAAQGELTDEQIFTEYLNQEDKYWDIQFDKAKTDEQQERVRQARIETTFWRQRMKAQIRQMNASASESEENVKTLRVLRPEQLKSLRLDNDSKGEDLKLKRETMDATINKMKSELAANSAISDVKRMEATKEIITLEQEFDDYYQHPSLERWHRIVKYLNNNMPVVSAFKDLFTPTK